MFTKGNLTVDRLSTFNIFVL